MLIEKASLAGGDTIRCHNDILAFWPDRPNEQGEVDDFDSYLEDWKATHWASIKGVNGEPLSEEFPFAERFMNAWKDAGEWLENEAGVVFEPVILGNALATNNTYEPHTWHAEIPILSTISEVCDTWDDFTLLLNSRVFEIMLDEGGKAMGVKFVDEGGAVRAAHANKGVVIATGTFCAAKDMIFNYYDENMAAIVNSGNMNATGDGHKMAQQVGAGLRDMELGFNWMPGGTGSLNWDTIEGRLYLFGGSEDSLALYDPAICINQLGRRYYAENMGYCGMGRETAAQPNRMGYYVFDGTFPAEDIYYEGSYVMVKDDTTFYKADTLEELAVRMNVPEEDFLAEIERWNGFCESGIDEDFGRPMDGITPIATPPFYAFPITPMIYITYGGIMTDVDSHVLTPEGEIIPGLYAAGVCCGCYAEQEGLLYQGGCDQALTFGYQAGIKAATES